MTDKFKAAFDKIQAEEKLKKDTYLYIADRINKRGKKNSRFFVNKVAIVVAALVLITFTGAFSYNIYFTASAYVDLDVDRPIELTINRFDRIIGVNDYNGYGEDIISGLSLKHKDYEEGFKILIDAVEKNGYLQDDGLVAVTFQTNNTANENQLLSNIQSGLKSALHGHHYALQIDVFPVSSDTRLNARLQNISPAKYLAITELMSADPTATFDSCKNHSIRELKRLTAADAGNHHGRGTGNIDDNVNDSVNETINNNIDENGNCGHDDNSSQQLIENKGHHGRNHGNRHN